MDFQERMGYNNRALLRTARNYKSLKMILYNPLMPSGPFFPNKLEKTIILRVYGLFIFYLFLEIDVNFM